jgi:hypothetical protein
MAVGVATQRISAAALRHALATAAVFLGIFYYFYGPPLTERFSEAAHDRCNALTGSNYRSYALRWQTTTYQSLSVPHWKCHDLSDPGNPGWNLGWWVDL